MAHTKRELLFVYGFIKHGHPLRALTHEQRKKKLKQAKKAGTQHELLNLVVEEEMEVAIGRFQGTGYPNSTATLKLIYESADSSLEGAYYWVLEHMRMERGFFDIEKILDIYAASEASAFWGNQQQRVSAQQNQASGLLQNIGKFIRDLFQMVRELRIIDERLEAYNSWETSPSADITLKSIFTDLVEGGQKNPQSVFGLAATVSFTLLPDLFFNTRVYSVDELDNVIGRMTYNTSVKNVLRRKLFQFIVWKKKTHVELQNRRGFNIQYLRQHWAIIKLYMSWIKPYIRNVKALQMRQQGVDTDPDLVGSFDTNVTEVEFLAKLPPKKGGLFPVVIVNFNFRSRPDMTIRREYQQGPSHLGRVALTFRSYGWTESDINAYRKMRDQEEIELIGVLDDTLGAIMEELGEDLRRYVNEREEEQPDKHAKRMEQQKKVREATLGAVEPFVSVFKGFGELFGPLVPLPSAGKSSGKSKKDPSEERRHKVAGDATVQMHMTWHLHKKNRRFITW